MGVLNVTPDSFSDGGRWLDPRRCGRPGSTHGRPRAPTIIDVGGESTRPGADPVDEREELARVMPDHRGIGAPRAGVHRHHQAGGGRGGRRRRRHHHQRRVRLPRGRGRRDRAGLGRHAHAGHAPDDAGRAPLRRRGGRGVRLPRGAGREGRPAGVAEIWIDPGIGFGKTGGPQPVAPAPSGHVRGHGLAGCGRRQPQVVPRPSDRRRRRR